MVLKSTLCAHSLANVRPSHMISFYILYMRSRKERNDTIGTEEEKEAQKRDPLKYPNQAIAV